MFNEPSCILNIREISEQKTISILQNYLFPTLSCLSKHKLTDLHGVTNINCEAVSCNDVTHHICVYVT